MVKRFVPEAMGTQRDHYIFVQSVDTENLSPDFPWLTQEIGKGTRDATVLFVNGTCFGYEMRSTRAELKVEDWRTLISSDRDQWLAWHLPEEIQRRITTYMSRLGLRFGRLDFLKSDTVLEFLEVNPNGQFGWVDEPDVWSLHRAVLDAVLDPTSAVRGDNAIREAV